MTKLERIVTQLKESNLITDMVEFSTDWAERSRCWCGFTLHKKRDMSIDTTINVLINTRRRIKHYESKRRVTGFLADEALTTLNSIEKELSSYLLHEHKIATLAE